MNGFLQSIFPFQGPSALRAQGLTEFVNTRTGTLWGQVFNLPTKRQDDNLPPQESWYVSWKPRIEFVLALVGLVITAPHFRPYFPRRFPLARALARRWGRPVKLLNDADMQGAAVIRGHGLELVVTLGTGMGTALFLDGALLPHLELAQHPSPTGKIYNAYVGDKVLKRIGTRAWNRRVRIALEALRTLVNYDRLYVGGGNSRHVTLALPNMRLVSNRAGVLGGIALWKALRSSSRASGRTGR